ncbi:dihydroorotase [Desulforudis sp. 1088]|uniref:dihydroorotase n=2 Tax=Candidatus Desulforudis TaxID=471826 RepID=UPI003CE5BF15
MRLLFKGGTLVDVAGGGLYRADLLVDDGRIAAIDREIGSEGVDVLDVSGLLVAPGLIDMHVHLREPGHEHKETIASGTAAAVRGGFTAVAAMPNTEPVADSAGVVRLILERARQAGRARVYPICALTKGSCGEQLSPMEELAAAGAVAFSDDGRSVRSARVMRRAMEYAASVGRVVIAHCEDHDLSAGGAMHEGAVATRLGLHGIPAAAEEIVVARDILLAEATGCRLHIAHVSTAGSVRLVREAKARGLPVTAEAAPHHFILTDEAVLGYDTNAKVNPPLRSARDVAAVREGLADGTIDVIATDHAPHAAHEKDVEFDRAPCGIVGLETAVGLVFAELVETGLLSPAQAIAKMSLNPAAILGVEGGRLEAGGPADITVIDPARKEVIDRASFAGKSTNMPFQDREVKGIPVITMVRGKILMRDRLLTNRQVCGGGQ